MVNIYFLSIQQIDVDFQHWYFSFEINHLLLASYQYSIKWDLSCTPLQSFFQCKERYLSHPFNGYPEHSVLSFPWQCHLYPNIYQRQCQLHKDYLRLLANTARCFRKTFQKCYYHTRMRSWLQFVVNRFQFACQQR